MQVSERRTAAWEAFATLPEVSVIEAGIFEEEGSEVKQVREGDSDMTLAEIANVHEFGALLKDKDGKVIGEIPARSFIRAWFDENEDAIQAKFAERLERLGPEHWALALNQTALWIQSEIQRRIRRRIPPPLEQATKDRKRSSVPLIDTSQLLSAILAKVDGNPPA